MLGEPGWPGRRITMRREVEWLAIFTIIAIVGGLSEFASGQTADVSQDKSSFLIAKRELRNPLFEKSVVLMMPFRNEDLVVGLIVNRATRVPLSDAFPKESSFKNRTDTIYFGGPVDTDTPGMLFRSSKDFKKAYHLNSDLYVTFDADLIDSLLKKKPGQVSDTRVFLGRSQWAPDQLRDEMEAGAWFGEQEENRIVFSEQVGDVWPQLIGSLEPGDVAELILPQRPNIERIF
jgi:putative transcriptional regulator